MLAKSASCWDLRDNFTIYFGDIAFIRKRYKSYQPDQAKISFIEIHSIYNPGVLDIFSQRFNSESY